MGRDGDRAGGGYKPSLCQCNFRTDPRSRGVGAGVRRPRRLGFCPVRFTVHVDFPGHEPCARRGSESLEEIPEPLLASYLPSDPDAAVYVRLEGDPDARMKAASRAA